MFSQSPISFYVNFCHTFRPGQKRIDHTSSYPEYWSHLKYDAVKLSEDSGNRAHGHSHHCRLLSVVQLKFGKSLTRTASAKGIHVVTFLSGSPCPGQATSNEIT